MSARHTLLQITMQLGTVLYCMCQVAEARHHRQLEKEKAERENALFRHEMAEEQRMLKAQKVQPPAKSVLLHLLPGVIC